MTPEDCMQRIADGDEAALGGLYDQLGGRLFALARRITNNDREAGDVVQDVFVTAWRQAKTFEPTCLSATAWLTTMARQRSIDRLRASRRQLPLAPADAGERPEMRDPALNPAPAAPPDDRREQIGEWIDDLPANQRQAVELAFFEGLTHPEIATRLNETIGAVKSRIRLGLDRLRHKLKGSIG